jgi:hypothetical protein
MTKHEEEIFIRERTKLANNEFDVIGVDPTQLAWLQGEMLVVVPSSVREHAKCYSKD